jgi:hypothetical protein
MKTSERGPGNHIAVGEGRFSIGRQASVIEPGNPLRLVRHGPTGMQEASTRFADGQPISIAVRSPEPANFSPPASEPLVYQLPSLPALR